MPPSANRPALIAFIMWLPYLATDAALTMYSPLEAMTGTESLVGLPGPWIMPPAANVPGWTACAKPPPAPMGVFAAAMLYRPVPVMLTLTALPCRSTMLRDRPFTYAVAALADMPEFSRSLISRARSACPLDVAMVLFVMSAV